MFNKQTGEVTLPASQGEDASVADGVLTSDHSGAIQPETGYESSQKGETPQPALRKRKVQPLPLCQSLSHSFYQDTFDKGRPFDHYTTHHDTIPISHG